MKGFLIRTEFVIISSELLPDLAHKRLHILRLLAILPEYPEGGPVDLDAPDPAKGLQQLLNDNGPQGPEPIHGLAHKDEHIHGGQLVGVRQELHQDGNNGAGHVWELDARGVERAHQQLTVFPRVLVLHHALGLGDLLFEDEHHLLDVARGDQLHGDVERLAPHLDVGRGEDAEDVHDGLLEDLLVAGHLLHGNQPVEDDQLYVVVALFDDEVDVGRDGGLHGGGRAGERDERAGRLVANTGRARVQKVVNAPNKPKQKIQ